MGLGLFKFSEKKSGCDYENSRISPLDPDPRRFTIKKHFEMAGNTAIFIRYPNCVNYEGDKIIVYKGVGFDEIKSLKEIDPHFTEENTIKPFARFEPLI